jgi:hypothetical protein
VVPSGAVKIAHMRLLRAQMSQARNWHHSHLKIASMKITPDVAGVLHAELSAKFRNVCSSIVQCGNSDRLHVALQVALHRARPFSTVSAWSAAIGCERSTLWRSWRNCEALDGISAQAVLRDIQVLRILELLQRGVTLERSANLLGLRPESASRILRRAVRSR